MIGNYWYHKSIKKVIATFGSLFSDVKIMAGTGAIIKVPIHYAHKQKWIEMIANNEDFRDLNTDIGLPVMGFEIVNFLYNPEQMSNPVHVQHSKQNNDKVDFMFTSVPYTIGIELYIATNTMDEGYQIIEQITPFFAPQLTVTIKDIEAYNINTNITFDLTALSQDVQYESVFDEKRTIVFNVSFNVHTKFHSNPREITRIKNVIINMCEKDYDEVFETLTGNREVGDDTFTWSK